ncbi:MAG: trypsin-like peptidase domain-containing protein [Ahniella sp.]|nr:trypsin-like peptidase domain-containing protein [Ahniella sp.]
MRIQFLIYPAIALLLLLAASAIGAQTIYKWVDANGRVQYTQTPPPTGTRATTQDMGKPEANPERARYCESIRKVAIRIDSYRASGTPLAAIDGHLATLETEYSVNVSVIAMREVASYVYGSGRPGRYDNDMPTRVFNACIGGSFGKFAMKSGNSSSRKSPEDALGEGAKSGTGWVTSGKVATNYHVVRGSSNVRIVLHDGRTLKATTESVDAKNDVAVLAVSGTLPAGIPLAEKEAGMGADVFTLGFPHTDIMGHNAKLATGIVSATTGMGDDPRFYQISVPVQSGNSGGPLVDGEGRLVALVTAKLSATQVFERTGDLPQNVNYAIKVAYLKPLLGIGAAKDLPASPAGDLESLANRITPAVVRVIAE